MIVNGVLTYMRLCANFGNVPSNQSWNGEAEVPSTR